MISYTYPYKLNNNGHKRTNVQMGAWYDIITQVVTGVTGLVTGAVTGSLTVAQQLAKTLGPEYLAKVSGLTDQLNSNMQRVETARAESAKRGYVIQSMLKDTIPKLIALQGTSFSSRANASQRNSAAIMQTAFTLAESLRVLNLDLASKTATIMKSPAEAGNYTAYLNLALAKGAELIAKVAINKQDFDKWYSDLQGILSDWKNESVSSYVKDEAQKLIDKGQELVKTGEKILSSSPMTIPLAIGAALFLYMMVNKRR